MDAKHWGDRLAALLRERGWKQQDLADATGLESGTITRYVKGQRKRPDINDVLKICEKLETTVEWLFTGGGQRSKRKPIGNELFRDFAWPSDASEAVRNKALLQLLDEQEAHRRALTVFWSRRLTTIVTAELLRDPSAD